ncbi:MAG: hypothetical protein HC803_03975 [Saprospiraceae bacterium]|nr:hypothetical protein [Saprospiraceae bacterium]
MKNVFCILFMCFILISCNTNVEHSKSNNILNKDSVEVYQKLDYNFEEKPYKIFFEQYNHEIIELTGYLNELNIKLDLRNDKLPENTSDIGSYSVKNPIPFSFNIVPNYTLIHKYEYEELKNILEYDFNMKFGTLNIGRNQMFGEKLNFSIPNNHSFSSFLGENILLSPYQFSSMKKDCHIQIFHVLSNGKHLKSRYDIFLLIITGNSFQLRIIGELNKPKTQNGKS